MTGFSQEELELLADAIRMAKPLIILLIIFLVIVFKNWREEQ